MKHYTLDGCQMYSVSRAHAYMKETLGFPDYYGNNLDALYDCLTEMEAELTIVHSGLMKESLGEYFYRLLRVLEDAQAENPALNVQLL